jgi:hypothetical protein
MNEILASLFIPAEAYLAISAVAGIVASAIL